MALAGWRCRVITAPVDERVQPGEDPQAYVLRLAESKARAAQASSDLLAHPEALILAADTAVVLDGRILGKPADPEAAGEMLGRLRGRTHQVYTGLAFLRLSDGRFAVEACTTEVRMRNYSNAEVAAYIDTGDPLDKAGAYAIQHSGFYPVDSVSGCYANVTGLPLCRVAHGLGQFGLSPEPAARLSCPGPGEGACPVASFVDELNS